MAQKLDDNELVSYKELLITNPIQVKRIQAYAGQIWISQTDPFYFAAVVKGLFNSVD